MAGFSTDRATIDANAGQVILTLRENLDRVGRIKAWLDGRTDASLVEMGWTPDEVATLKSAFTALDHLRRVAAGQATQPEASDFFFFFAGRLTGIQ